MRKRIISTIAMLLVACMVLSAAAAADLYQKFSEDVAAGDVAAAIDTYDELSQRIANDRSKAIRSYEKAMDAGNMQKAMAARNDYRAVASLSMSKEDTDALLSAILKEDDASAMEHAKWLYSNSSYYCPTLSYEWSSSSDTFSYSYSRSISVVPGSEITLPTADEIGVDSSMAGVLVGWGVTPDEVTYQAGETISAPLTSQTLYAIWTTRVLFEDPVTGVESSFDDINTGDSVTIPVLTAPDDSYVFAGWVDETTGEYLAPFDEEYKLEGNGAIFTALWKKVEMNDLKGSLYDIAALPLNTQEELEFTLTNSGTEDLRSLSIEVTGSEGLTVLTGRGKVSFLNDGSSLKMTGLRVVATEAGDHTLTVTVTDRDGDAWTSDFTVSAE